MLERPNGPASEFAVDKELEKLFSDGQIGTYVDVGAGWPYCYSNSYLFRTKGWQIVPVEANPFMCEDYRAQDFDIIEGACSDTEGEMTLYYPLHTWGLGGAYRPPPSGEYKTVTVKMFTLDSVLENLNITEIDILDVDVEGMEAVVFRGFDLEKYKPKVILVEGHFNDTTTTADIEVKELLINHGYKNTFNHVWNHIWRI